VNIPDFIAITALATQRRRQQQARRARGADDIPTIDLQRLAG
jgi:hypothetical protein